jgi:hypothetical protein
MLFSSERALYELIMERTAHQPLYQLHQVSIYIHLRKTLSGDEFVDFEYNAPLELKIIGEFIPPADAGGYSHLALSELLKRFLLN